MTTPPDLRLATPDEVFLFRVAFVIGLFGGAGAFELGGWPLVTVIACAWLVITRCLSWLPGRRAR
jgi:hypothetical protein